MMDYKTLWSAARYLNCEINDLFEINEEYENKILQKKIHNIIDLIESLKE